MCVCVARWELGGWEGHEVEVEGGAGGMTGWGGRVEPKPHAARRMTTDRTRGRLGTSILMREVLVPPSRPPVGQLQPVLVSWWSGNGGRFLRKG